jgi:addiction module RelB/DinJ family antitoxin
VNTSDAITMFLQQVVIQQGLPFDVCTRQHIPNAETRKALRELDDPKKRSKLKAYVTTDEMFEDIFGKKKWELMKKQRGS